jgi:hypothetical protein
MHHRHHIMSETSPKEQTKIHLRHIPVTGYRLNHHWQRWKETWVGGFCRPRE